MYCSAVQGSAVKCRAVQYIIKMFRGGGGGGGEGTEKDGIRPYYILKEEKKCDYKNNKKNPESLISC